MLCCVSDWLSVMELGSYSDQSKSTFSLVDEDHTFANSVRFTLNQELVVWIFLCYSLDLFIILWVRSFSINEACYSPVQCLKYMHYQYCVLLFGIISLKHNGFLERRPTVLPGIGYGILQSRKLWIQKEH